MRRLALSLALAAVVSCASAAPPPARFGQTAIDTAVQLREQALASDLAWQLTEALTTEVGPRLPGSEADARAVQWAKARFEQLGYDKVWLEPVTFPKWVRRSESGEVLGAHAQKLVLTALGYSPGGTVEGEVVRFDSLEALEAAPAGSLAGKIAFVDVSMQRKQDGADYSRGGAVRGNGPSIASSKGAIGFVMRSASTSWQRVANTGGTRFAEGVRPIPAAALSLPDAEQLARLVKLGPTRIRVSLDCGFDGEYTSHNVIGEITGSKHPEQVVLLGGHLDSWDHGTGAIDDAAGVALTMATGALLKPLRPERSIRVVAYANEEQGLWGGRAYADAHAAEAGKHVVAIESDFGAGRIYGFDSSARDGQPEAMRQFMQVLAPLGIEWMPGQGHPESDIGPMTRHGVAWAWLGHDATNYFDLHHNADDTLDKIDPKDLAQNFAAYVAFTWLASQSSVDFSAAPAAAGAGR